MGLDFHRSDRLAPNQGYEQDISTQLLRMGCALCGRPLRDPVSLERGWGPICDEKHMGGSGHARVWSQLAEAFDVHGVADALREAPRVIPTRWREPVIDRASGKPIILSGPYKKGQELPDGTKALGGEIELKTRPIRPGSLHDYWVKKGGAADDENAAWRTSPETRRTMVSNGIWYASRAVTYGFDEDVVSAEKVDPKWMIVAAVQRFARAVGLPRAADRMTEFYSAKVATQVRTQRKKAQKAQKKNIIFEQVPADYRVEQWDNQARRKTVMPVGPGVTRIHAPYSQEFNDLARANRDIFFAIEGEKDQWSFQEAKTEALFWRYFRQENLRKVINIVQGVWGDRVCITRSMQTVEDRKRQKRERAGLTAVLDTSTATVRMFPPATAKKLVAASSFMGLDSKGNEVTKEGRYRIIKDR